MNRLVLVGLIMALGIIWAVPGAAASEDISQERLTRWALWFLQEDYLAIVEDTQSGDSSDPALVFPGGASEGEVPELAGVIYRQARRRTEKLPATEAAIQQVRQDIFRDDALRQRLTDANQLTSGKLPRSSLFSGVSSGKEGEVSWVGGRDQSRLTASYLGFLLFVVYLLIMVFSPFFRGSRDPWRRLHQKSAAGRAVWADFHRAADSLDFDLRQEVLRMAAPYREEGRAAEREIPRLLRRLEPLLRETETVGFPAAGEDFPRDKSWESEIARRIGRRTGRPGNSEKVAALFAEMIREAENRGGDSDGEGFFDPGEAWRIGLVHDVGYLTIPGEVFRYRGSLPEAGQERIQDHVLRGAEVLRKRGFSEQAVQAVLAHHERQDGSGYPRGLQGEAIPTAARILAAADVYTALTSPRSYRAALSPREGIELMEEMAGIRLDGGAVELLRGVLELRGDIPS